MHNSIFRSAAILTALFITVKAVAQGPVLLEFGWDYPDLTKLTNSKLDSMQNTAFDGFCFSFERKIMEAFDTTAKKDAYFRYNQLKSLKWGKYKYNYLIIRGFSKTGGNWLNDDAWRTIVANTEKLSKAMQVGNVKGIMFDPEYYYDDKLFDPWTYSEKQYPFQSFEQMQEVVRKRGIQYIRALQKYQQRFDFLSIWLASLIEQDKKRAPISKTRHALLVSFIEGLLTGKNSTVKITDGNEYGYWYTRPSEFVEADRSLKRTLEECMTTRQGKKLIPLVKTAQPIFYDGLLAKAPRFDKGVSNDGKWNWLRENLKYAMAATDELVWFYGERINWWNDSKISDTLTSIINEVKTSFTKPATGKSAGLKSIPVTSGCNNVNSGTGCYYTASKEKPMQAGEAAFGFTVNKTKTVLTINFKDSLPAEVKIYFNNRLIHTAQPVKSTYSCKTPAFKNGRLFIFARYANKKEAAGIQVYQ